MARATLPIRAARYNLDTTVTMTGKVAGFTAPVGSLTMSVGRARSASRL